MAKHRYGKKKSHKKSKKSKHRKSLKRSRAAKRRYRQSGLYRYNLRRKRSKKNKKLKHRGKKHRVSRHVAATIKHAYHVVPMMGARARRAEESKTHQVSYLAKKRAELEAMRARRAHQPGSGLPSWF